MFQLTRRRSQPTLRPNARAEPPPPPIPDAATRPSTQHPTSTSISTNTGAPGRRGSGKSTGQAIMRRVTTLLSLSPNSSSKKSSEISALGAGVCHIASNTKSSSANSSQEWADTESVRGDSTDEIRRPSGLGPPSILNWVEADENDQDNGPPPVLPSQPLERQNESGKLKKPRPVSSPNMAYKSYVDATVEVPPLPSATVVSPSSPPAPRTTARPIPPATGSLSRRKTMRVRPPPLTIISLPLAILELIASFTTYHYPHALHPAHTHVHLPALSLTCKTLHVPANTILYGLTQLTISLGSSSHTRGARLFPARELPLLCSLSVTDTPADAQMYALGLWLSRNSAAPLREVHFLSSSSLGSDDTQWSNATRSIWASGDVLPHLQVITASPGLFNIILGQPVGVNDPRSTLLSRSDSNLPLPPSTPSVSSSSNIDPSLSSRGPPPPSFSNPFSTSSPQEPRPISRPTSPRPPDLPRRNPSRPSLTSSRSSSSASRPTTPTPSPAPLILQMENIGISPDTKTAAITTPTQLAVRTPIPRTPLTPISSAFCVVTPATPTGATSDNSINISPTNTVNILTPPIHKPKHFALKHVTIVINTSLYHGLRPTEVLRPLIPSSSSFASPASSSSSSPSTSLTTAESESESRSAAHGEDVISSHGAEHATINTIRPPPRLTFQFGPRVDRRTIEKMLGVAGSVLGSSTSDEVSGLQALEVVVVESSSVVPELLYKSITSVLPRFPCLSVLRVHADGVRRKAVSLRDEEKNYVMTFTRRCPTLREIVFVSGAAWHIAE